MADKLNKKIKSGKYALSPKSYNYLLLKAKKGEGTIKIPKTNARQDELVDFLFTKFQKQIEKVGNNEVIDRESFEIILKDNSLTKVPLAWIYFDTTEVRKEMGLPSYTDKQIIEDLEFLRASSLEVKSVKIWADENGKYKGEDRLTFSGSICGERVVKEEKRRGRQTIASIAVVIPMVSGLIWRNDAIRKRYSLFLKDKNDERCFSKMPAPARRIYRYLSLWTWKKDTELTLRQFCDILNWKQNHRNFSKTKSKIEDILNELKEKRYIDSWIRIEDTKGWETRWRIQYLRARRRLEE